jgi:hypothetical protein
MASMLDKFNAGKPLPFFRFRLFEAGVQKPGSAMKDHQRLETLNQFSVG